MYAGMKKIIEVIDYIEENIDSDLNCKVLASIMGLSVYEFRRIFTFIVGCPLAEYIRKRRMSLAAVEILKNKKVDLLELSQKYGYSSQPAFTKAFSEHHGVSPTLFLKESANINFFTVPKFDFNITESENITFSIQKYKEFYIQGFSEVSAITDTCCCENVWNGFYEKKIDKQLDTDRIYVSYKNNDNDVLCTIGKKTIQLSDKLPFEKIAESFWACFKLNTVDDEIVNEFYSKILYEWLPSANLVKNDFIPVVEVYPSDMSQDGFEWEIRIPVYQ